MKRGAAGGEQAQVPAAAIPRKWLAMVAGIWIQSVSGTASSFGIYSPLLKSTQNYDQTTLGTIGFFKDIGANAGVIAGAVYSSSSGEGRPRLVLVAGAVQCFLGYFFMWLAISGIVHRPPVSFMYLFMFLGAHSLSFFNTANVVPAAINFSDHRGTAIGIMKGYLGLSGAILIEVYRTMFSGDPSYYLLMLALLPTAISLIFMYFVRVEPKSCGNDGPLLNNISLIALITTGYLMIVILLENVLNFGTSVRIPTILLMFIFLVSPASILLKDHSSAPSLVPDSVYEQKLLSADSTDSSEAARAGSDRELNLFQAIQTCEFWLMFISVACGMGSGLATVNNISQIGSSLGYRRMDIDTLVSLWSIWNFTGRFGAGYISDYYQRSSGCARPLFMSLSLAGMTVGHGLIASGLPGSLFTGYVAVGLCYGSQWCLMPTITSELFGFRHLGTIFNALAIASPCGSYVLSVRVVGYIYDAESRGGACSGIRCFRLSFVIMALVSLGGFCVSLVFFFRTRKFYERFVNGRLRLLG